MKKRLEIFTQCAYCIFDKDFVNNFLHRNFCIKGAVDLNEWYLFLGLDTTDFGSTVGWSEEMYDFYGYAFIDFVYDEVTEVDGSFIAIRMPFPPVSEFMGEE